MRRQSRYIEALVTGDSGVCRVGCLYLPNGNPITTEKFPYKLAWMEAFERHVRGRLALEEPLVLAGDYNVIPTPMDAKRPEAWVNDALFQPQTRAAYQRLTGLGLTDAIRACHPGPGPTPSGTIRPAPGRRTTASASTTCCCRRKPPTA